jgi:hypothetical protein
MTFITICHNPSLGLMTKARACKVARQEWAQESHFMIPGVQKSVREWTLPLPNGFLNFQRAITMVKSHWIEMFFISLKSSWKVDVWNGLALPIWTFETQVMAKRRAGS